jgi:hypothetical protein
MPISIEELEMALPLENTIRVLKNYTTLLNITKLGTLELYLFSYL